MPPVVVIRFSQTEGPGYLGDFLTNQGVLWTQINIDSGEPLPAGPEAFSGLVLMGGPMSVNDDLPWIEPLLELIRRSIAGGVPVLGHCLGGQLMSKALGAQVTRNAVKEIGWGTVSKVGLNPAPAWLGELPANFEVFQWHGETFSIPDGATRVLESAFCPNQAWLLDDRHLALQCHVEMTDAMIPAWCEAGAAEIREASSSPAVQTASVMQADMTARVHALHEVADKLYAKWISGLSD